MSVKKTKGLGKGFDALMPQGVGSVLNKNTARVQELFITVIEPNKDQPRREFDETTMNELAESIKQHGVLQPILVTPKGDDKYEIVAGERRWRASKMAGLTSIPAIVRTAKELEKLELALVENVQRVDLSPLEQAASIKRLNELFNVEVSDIAKRLNKAESTVSNIVRLLNLPPAAQEALRRKTITEGHARAILALKDYPELQEKLLLAIQKNGWSVRQAEQFAVAAKSGSKEESKAKKRTDQITPETKELSKILKREVTVNHMAKGGRLVIRFNTDDDLEKLINLLSSIKK